MKLNPCPFFRILFIALAAITMGVSCAGTGHFHSKQPLKAEVLYKSAFCGPHAQNEGHMWIDTKKALKDFLQSHKSTLTPPPLPSWSADLDFSNHRILAIFMGQRPTAGYSLEYIPEKSYSTGSTARITIKYITPPPGAITAQVMTSPCLLLRVQQNILKCEIHRLSD
jgi:hypothetical protein